MIKISEKLKQKCFKIITDLFTLKIYTYIFTLFSFIEFVQIGIRCEPFKKNIILKCSFKKVFIRKQIIV